MNEIVLSYLLILAGLLDEVNEFVELHLRLPIRERLCWFQLLLLALFWLIVRGVGCRLVDL